MPTSRFDPLNHLLAGPATRRSVASLAAGGASTVLAGDHAPAKNK